MHDKRLIDLKLRAERDRRLSDGAHRLLALIISDRYLSRDDPENPFPLAWSWVSHLTGRSKKRCYERLSGLISMGYLVRAGVSGSPPTCSYRLLLIGGENASFKGVGNATLKRGEKAAIERGENASNHTYNPPSEERIRPEGRNVAASPGTGEEGKRAPAAPSGAGAGKESAVGGNGSDKPSVAALIAALRASVAGLPPEGKTAQPPSQPIARGPAGIDWPPLGKRNIA